MAKKQIDMTDGKAIKLLTAFTIPALISNFLSQIYSLTDSIIVGRIIGKQALAAIGVCMPVILLIVSIVIGVNIGCGVLFSQSFGRKNFERMRHLLVNSFYFAAVLSFVIGLGGFFLAKPILIALNTPEGPLKEATKYLQVNFLTTIFPLLYYLLYNAFRGMGDSISALMCLVVSVVFNILLDLLFVMVFKMGVAGTAIATALAQMFAVIFAFIILNIKYKELRIKKNDLYLDMPLIGNVVHLAIPFALQSSVNNLGNIVVQRCINGFGDTVMASYTIASRIGAFALIPVENVGSSLSVYVGQNLGAQKEERISEGVKASHILNLILSSVVAILVLFLGKNITNVFLDEADEEIIKISYSYLIIAAAPCVLCGIMHIYQNVLKGLGRGRDTVISGFIQLGAKVSVALVGAYTLKNVNVIWFGWPISFVVGMIYPIIRYVLYKRKLNNNLSQKMIQ